MSTPRFELGTDGPTTILVGVDGSTTSMRAAAYAAGLARRQDADLLVLFVMSPSALASMDARTGVLYQESQAVVAAQLQEEMQAAADSVGLRLELLTVGGDPYDQLSRVADERRADAVVVGASESAGHRLIGSLATRLVKAGKWPVTVVP